MIGGDSIQREYCPDPDKYVLTRVKIEEVPTVETTDVEPFSAARCWVFKRSNNNRKVNLHERLNVSTYCLGVSVCLNSFLVFSLAAYLSKFLPDFPPFFLSPLG